MNGIEIYKKNEHWIAVVRRIKCYGTGKTKAEALKDLKKDIEITLKYGSVV